MTKSSPALDDWRPPTLDAIQEVFANAPFRWWVCGGVALDLHAGRTWRSHDDLDIGILRAETDQVYPWLRDWDLWVAAQGKLRPWQGEPLRAETGENNVWARDSSTSSWRFDLTVSSGDHSEWVYRRDEKIRRDWDTTVLWTADNLPYLAPEIQLLFKSRNRRPKDDLDARQVIPLLDPTQRAFLADHLDDDHPWQTLITRGVPSPIQVVGGLLHTEDRVLLCHRRADRDHYPDVWDLPGGRVEAGETLAGALIRELEEELGIIARLSDNDPWITLMNDTLDLHIYLIDDWQGVPDNVATDEHDEIRWATPGDAGDLDLADDSYMELIRRALD